MNEFSFANRTQWALTPNELTRLLEKLEKNGRRVINLTESNPTRCGFSYPKEALLKALHTPDNLRYEPSARGMLKARQAVAGYYRKKNLKVSADNIFLTSSTSEGYSFLFRLLLNSKERILAPYPSYPLFEFLAQINDVGMDDYPLIYDNHWHVDLPALQELISSRTRAIILVNPNNPTGSFVKPEELVAINDICMKNQMAIICDEVFLDYAFLGKGRSLSLANNRKTLTFVLSGISKCLALPQMKIGWIAISGPDSIVAETKKRLEIISDTYLSVNTPSQNALSTWLGFQSFLQRDILKRLKNNRTFLLKNLASVPSCECLKVEGGWYAVLRLPSVLSEEQWALEFLKKDSVFVHPGYFFDFETGSFIVLSLLLPFRIFKEGVKRIIKRIKAEVSY